MGDENGVVVTPREIYDAVMGLRSDMQRVSDALPDIQRDIDEFKVWRRVVDRWRYGIPLATLIAVGSTVAAIYPRK